MGNIKRKKVNALPKTKEKSLEKASLVADDETKDRITKYGSLIIGLCIAVYIGNYYTNYSKALHENNLWFSNIKPLEQEISFRTESGLYYSYYKQMVLAPSITQGLYDLINDNKTEHLRTINIIERFNVYQEIVLAIMYRASPLKWQESTGYIFFYINTIFSMHGVYMVALFCCAWMISGSFLAGALANAFYIFNRGDVTRLSYTVPLRESFSLPFIFLQMAVLTYYLKKDITDTAKKVCLLFIGLFTLCYVIAWQFAQFVLLLQSFAIFAVYVLEFVPAKKVAPLYWIFLINLSTVCIMQFGNDMLYTSLVSSFCISSIVLLIFQTENGVKRNFFIKLLLMIVQIFFVLGFSFAINTVIKKVTRVDSDEHVFKFVSTKLGYGTALKDDFDARLYLCNGGFQYLPWNTFTRLTDGLVFPLYAGSTLMFLIVLAFAYFQKLRNEESVLDEYPELVFNVILDIFFGGMALTTLRMKFLWLPHMIIVAAGLFSHQQSWKLCLNALHIEKGFNFIIRQSAPIILISILMFQKLPSHQKELEDLREFYDPDTVQLMEWIRTNTAEDAAFTGTMQLLAGVKLCTDRHITNHPHYENKFLRQRTKEVYQMYAKKNPDEVYNTLKKHGTSYIILENSICYSKKEGNCALTDILDIDNGHPVRTNEPVVRFCHAIKTGGRSFTKYFKKVFENKTFYLYELL